MKKCPQCEFLYEDDQRLCDMDGASLVVDSRKLPNLNALEGNTAAVPVKNWRARAVPLFAGLVLAIVLSLVYYVQTQQSRPVASMPAATSSPVSQQLTTAPAASPEKQPTAAPTKEVKVVTPAEAPAKSETPAKSVKPKPANVKETPKNAKPKKPAAKTGQRAVSEKKKDSKLESLLKKTGRLFQRPF